MCRSGRRNDLNSRNEPIRESESRNMLIVGRIVSHQRQIVSQCNRRDQKVHATDDQALPKHRTPHSAELLGAIMLNSRRMISGSKSFSMLLSKGVELLR